MSRRINVPSGADGFAEDKEAARNLRLRRLLPALEAGETVVLDFGKVSYATQSYMHALLGEALRKFGEQVLERIEFRNCSSPVKSVIELVVDYSLAGFPDQQAS